MDENSTPSDTAANLPQDPALNKVVGEIEAYAAQAGWDQPGGLFALVETSVLVDKEPELAASVGVSGDQGAAGLTPVEQEIPEGEELEDLLAQIVWPEEVDGCAVVIERIVLPPEADGEVPEDPEEAATWAANHPDAQEVRIAVGVRRNGASCCVLRLRGHEEDGERLVGEDLVPGLLELVASTLVAEPEDA